VHRERSLPGLLLDRRLDTPTDLARYQELRALIARCADDDGRDPEGITLICVTKTVEAGRLDPILAAGHRVFGENRVQEAAGKWPDLRARFPGVELHLIGPLQTNKVRQALGLFDVIETIDRPKLAATLADEIQRAGHAPALYVQVNIGEEPQKAGVLPREADAFIRQCRTDFSLAIAGLMCIPPEGHQASPYFALTRNIAERNGLGILSMGMTGDWPLAVQLGATHIRVGSAIFGARSAR
jgi:pyridoxal phosphate enzyme (YggS family)